MANKIDKIHVGEADYEINLPITATPQITSLTVTGDLTVEGTANLSVVNVVGPTLSISYYDGQVVTILNSDYTYVADAGIGTYDGGSFEVCGDEDLYFRKSGYLYSLPNKSGTLKLGNNESFQIEHNNSYEYDLSDYTRAIITLSSFDDDGHADLTIEDDDKNIANDFHVEMDLTNF